MLVPDGRYGHRFLDTGIWPARTAGQTVDRVGTAWRRHGGVGLSASRGVFAIAIAKVTSNPTDEYLQQ